MYITESSHIQNAHVKRASTQKVCDGVRPDLYVSSVLTIPDLSTDVIFPIKCLTKIFSNKLI